LHTYTYIHIHKDKQVLVVFAQFVRRGPARIIRGVYKRWNSLEVLTKFPEILLAMSRKFLCVVLGALFIVQVSITLRPELLHNAT